MASTISVPIVVIVIPMAVANDWASRRCRFFGPLRTNSTQEMVEVEGLTLEGVRLRDFLPARTALLRLLWNSRRPTSCYEGRRSPATATGQRGSGWRYSTPHPKGRRRLEGRRGRQSPRTRRRECESPIFLLK